MSVDSPLAKWAQNGIYMMSQPYLAVYLRTLTLNAKPLEISR